MNRVIAIRAWLAISWLVLGLMLSVVTQVARADNAPAAAPAAIEQVQARVAD